MQDFLKQMKVANVSPIFKMEDKTNEINYRPISVLTFVSKIFERITFKQATNYYMYLSKAFNCLPR